MNGVGALTSADIVQVLKEVTHVVILSTRGRLGATPNVFIFSWANIGSGRGSVGHGAPILSSSGPRTLAPLRENLEHPERGRDLRLH